MSLAEFEAEDEGKDTVRIESKHLKRIVALSASFQRYINSMPGNRSDSYVAKQKNLRNDSYKETPSPNSEINTVKRSKYLSPIANEEASRAKTKERSFEDAEEVELEDQRLRSRDGKLRQQKITNTTPDDDLRRSRSKQPVQRTRHIAAIEEDSETELSKLKQGSRRAQRYEEEEVPEEADVPNRNMKASRPTRRLSHDSDAEDEDLSRQTGSSSQKTTKRMPVYMEREDEEDMPRMTRPTKRATMTYEDDGRYARRESRSPAKVTKGVAKKTMREVSESDEEM